MAEAEDVIADAARHATVYAQALWRRHRPAPPGPPVVTLAEVAPRLDLLIAAAFGASLPLRIAQPPPPPTLLMRWAGRHSAPPQRTALPGTDGRHLWLPSALPAGAGTALALEHYRTLALVQAQRALRSSAAIAATLREPPLHALFLLLEAHAADAALVARLPGMSAPLMRLRQGALQERPAVEALPVAVRGFERLAQALMAASPGESVPLAAAFNGTEAQGAARGVVLGLPADAATVLLRARELLSLLVGPGAPSVRRWFWADMWTGELRSPSPEALALPGTQEDGDDGAPGAPPRAARMPRRPEARQALDEEDHPSPPGPWMVQTAQPHEQAEDPMGMQRPTDRDTTTAADDFADALSELPEARLLASPGRPKEVLLSDDPPDASARRATAPPGEAGGAVALQYPEWDWRVRAYRAPGVTVRLGVAPDGSAHWLEQTLAERHGMLQAVRRHFELLRSQRSVVRRQIDGDDIDLDAWCEAHADFAAGLPLSERVYRRQSRHRRDLAVLVLIDVSGSTDGWVAPGRRVIDVGREALLVVSIALDGMGAPFGVQAFSGEGPQGVVVRNVKHFAEPYGPPVALRIAGLEGIVFDRRQRHRHHIQVLGRVLAQVGHHH
jgi:nitric oxide reductase NorD protein